MDILTKDQRSKLMARVRGKDTKPEMAVRRIAHGLGFRFRLHRPDLPGSPDLVFPRLKKAIFVNGCFWHRHVGCPKTYTPKTNVELWNKKFLMNVDRDKVALAKLQHLGWNVLTIWECQTEDRTGLVQKIEAFLTARSD